MKNYGDGKAVMLLQVFRQWWKIEKIMRERNLKNGGEKKIKS